MARQSGGWPMLKTEGRRQRALSIRQPFVELILRRKKRAEFRSQPTRLRGRVWLYASKRPADHEPSWRKLGKTRTALPVGMIVGTVEIFDCRWDEREDSYAYVLRNPRRLRMPLVAINQPQPRFWIPRFRAVPERKAKSRRQA